MELTAGTLVTEKVRLSRPLDQGSMGTLWVADHLGFNAEVVVKFILPEQAESNPQALARFNQEANALGGLKSQHVVTIFDRSEMPDGTPYIVMELLEGETLVERLERVGPLDPQLACKIVGQLADALTEVHAKGIIHRDLKAENIFLSGPERSPFVRLLDFGVAKLPQANRGPKLTAPGTLVGTPQYMSPTQTVSADAVDHQADQWALAVATYLSMACDFPFAGEAMPEIFMAIRTGQYQPLSAVRPDLGVAFDPWFARAFHTSPKQRFGTPAEMAEALEQAVLGWQLAQASQQQGLPAEPLVATPSQTNIVLIAVLIGSFLVIALLAAVLLFG